MHRKRDTHYRLTTHQASLRRSAVANIDVVLTHRLAARCDTLIATRHWLAGRLRRDVGGKQSPGYWESAENLIAACCCGQSHVDENMKRS